MARPFFKLQKKLGSDLLSILARSYPKVDLETCQPGSLGANAATRERAMVGATSLPQKTKQTQTRVFAAIERHLHINKSEQSTSPEDHSVQAKYVSRANTGENVIEAINKIGNHEPWKGMIRTLKKLMRAEDVLQRASARLNQEYYELGLQYFAYGVWICEDLQVPIPSEGSRGFHATVYPSFLQRLKADQPTAVFSEQALQKKLERARKFVMVAKAFGTAILDSPDLLNVTKIDVLTFSGLQEVVEKKGLGSGCNSFESGDFSRTRVPMEWTPNYSVPLS